VYDQIGSKGDDAQEAHHKLALVEALAGIGHWRFDLRTQKVTWSPQVYRIHGLAPDSFDPNYDDVVAAYHPDDRAVLQAYVARAAASGEGYEFKLRLQRPSDGALRYVIAKAEVDCDEIGSPRAIFGVFQDVTEQETALRNGEAAIKAKLQFLANISHELRTPLTSILGFAKILERSTPLQEEARSYAHRIAAAGETLLVIVNDLLDLAAMDVRALHLRTDRIRVSDVAQTALDLVEQEAHQKGLKLHLDIASDAPEFVFGDAARLRQVLLNLLANAVKFTDSGEVRVHVEAADQALRFSVTDTGPGVPRDRQRIIFDPFTQADPTIAARYGGTGLGLAICKRLIETMGGAIGVESEPGAGAAFWFLAPLPAAPAAAPAQRAERRLMPRRKLRVLLIEDHRSIQDIVGAILAPLGHTVEAASDGESGVEATALQAFDLIVVDGNLPGMKGAEAVREIRASGGPSAWAPILAMSAHADPAVERGFRAAGADAYLTKPIVVRELLAAIARLTQNAAAEDESVGEAEEEEWILRQA